MKALVIVILLTVLVTVGLRRNWHLTIIRFQKQRSLIRKRRAKSSLYANSFKKEFHSYLKEKKMEGQYYGMYFYTPLAVVALGLFVYKMWIRPAGALVELFAWAAVLGTGYLALNSIMCTLEATNAADEKSVKEVRAHLKKERQATATPPVTATTNTPTA